MNPDIIKEKLTGISRQIFVNSGITVEGNLIYLAVPYKHRFLLSDPALNKIHDAIQSGSGKTYRLLAQVMPPREEGH